VERNDDINPFWIEDKSLRKGPVAFLSAAEQQFWRDLIDKYLYPIDEDKDEKARIAADLIELRNKSVFSFFMINALFVLIVFLLQLNKDKLHLDWPIGVKTNITTVAETSEVKIILHFYILYYAQHDCIIKRNDYRSLLAKNIYTWNPSVWCSCSFSHSS